MIKRLEKLLNNSYSPYSNFQVASVVITEDGQEFEGVNVESAAYGVTVCAERNAITTAIAAGVEPKTIKEVHVVAKRRTDDSIEEFVTPCGICRQIIAEQSDNKATVITHKSNGETREEKISDLLPGAFLGDSLE